MRDLPVPEIEADSAILRIEACGICGSDYEQFEGVLKTPMPVIPGHEPVGIIEAIGDKAARRWGGRCRRPGGRRDHAVLPQLRHLPRGPLSPLR
ncbi:alcohol dehydrogenase catalytic domain-containing protein [Phenylobacterium sp. J426]|uniref:alcohol dehydrogenase catalytic domain-containing protein n=1 Tax=Phenylobacterium sp. J426 TaxID=2898439 RepID=UPI0035B3C260